MCIIGLLTRFLSIKGTSVLLLIEIVLTRYKNPQHVEAGPTIDNLFDLKGISNKRDLRTFEEIRKTVIMYASKR